MPCTCAFLNLTFKHLNFSIKELNLVWYSFVHEKQENNC